MGIIYKVRDYSKPNQDSVEKATFLGNCKGKDVLLVDDLIDTAGTIIKASEMLKNEHEAKSVTVVTPYYGYAR